MKVYNTKGELLTHIQLDAQDERVGQDVIYIVDVELKDLMQRILEHQKIIAYQLGIITGNILKEGDLDA